MLKKKNIFYFILSLSIILLIYLSFIVSKDINYKIKQTKNEKSIYNFIENNSRDVFSIDKITYFSSANSTSSINSNSSFNIENLIQYTDIAIFINNHSENGFDLENTIKILKISDINFSVKPSNRHS